VTSRTETGHLITRRFSSGGLAVTNSGREKHGRTGGPEDLEELEESDTSNQDHQPHPLPTRETDTGATHDEELRRSHRLVHKARVNYTDRIRTRAMDDLSNLVKALATFLR
ncbi:unnamed protein product, partial [Discosporangium mesarthrocarpum]